MSADPLKPATDTPPRTLYEWTTVEGHQVTGAKTGRARCTCGATQPLHALLLRGRVRDVRHEMTADQVSQVREAARAWHANHLANAWPSLVPRLADESFESHAQRVAVELTAARKVRDDLLSDLDSSGDTIPVPSQAHLDAGVRAAVLKHQYNEICEALRCEHPLKGSDEAMKWTIEAVGDPFDEF